MGPEAVDTAGGGSESRTSGTGEPETQPVSIRFDRTVIKHLRQRAREESLRRARDVSMADLIREAVTLTYLTDASPVIK